MLLPALDDPKFAAVSDAFESNLAAGLEAGAACAAVIDGRLVVDLWGGSADPRNRKPWARDTLVDCRSATKGLTALCLALLVDRGLVDFDDPVRDFWPGGSWYPSGMKLRPFCCGAMGITSVSATDLTPGAFEARSTTRRKNSSVCASDCCTAR